MGLFGPNISGSANSSAEGFIGVNTIATAEYVKDICGTAIKAAVEAAKQTNTVFTALETGWTGQSLENFKLNYAKAVVQLEKTLAQAYAALVKEVAAVADGMIEQDAQMVERQ